MKVYFTFMSKKCIITKYWKYVLSKLERFRQKKIKIFLQNVIFAIFSNNFILKHIISKQDVLLEVPNFSELKNIDIK